MAEMRRFEVGQLFIPGVTHYQEGGRFNFSSSGATLLLTWTTPRSKEVQEIKSGVFSAGLTVVGNILFFLCKFGNSQWMDFPFSPHLMSDKEIEIQHPEENQGYGLTIFLVDAATGILKAGRFIGLPHDFSITFEDYFRKLQSASFDLTEYDSLVKGVYNTYSTEQLLEKSIVRF
jgi:hypothetical protein